MGTEYRHDSASMLKCAPEDARIPIHYLVSNADMFGLKARGATSTTTSEGTRRNSITSLSPCVRNAIAPAVRIEANSNSYETNPGDSPQLQVDVMAKTRIAWTDFTFNPWWGCRKVSPGCKHCYAEAHDRRFGGDHFGGRTRKTFGTKHWSEPLKWDRAAKAAGRPALVFC